MSKSTPALPEKSSAIDHSKEASHPFYVWSGLLTPYHRSKIGSAIWVYLWCLRRVTAEHGGLGFVLGGSRIKIERIAEELGISSRSIGADLARLKQGGYLQVRRIPYGLIITVLKSKRGFDKKRSEENFRSEIGRNLPISPERSEENFRADRKKTSDIKEKAVRVSKQKRVSSGEASPHRKNSPSLKSGFKKKRTSG